MTISISKVYKAVPFVIALIGVFSIQQWLEIPVSAVPITFLCEAVVLGVCVMMGWRSRLMKEYRMPWQIVLFTGLVCLSAVYGVYMSEGYWDYKSLVTNFLTLTLGLSWWYFCQPSKVSYTLRIWLYFSMVAFWVLLPFMQGEGVGRFLVVISFLLIFAPYLEKRALIVVLILFVAVIIFGTLGSRSTVLRFLVCAMISAGVYFRNCIPEKVLKSVVIVEFILPPVLLVLAVTGVFNIFQMDEYLGISNIEVTNSFDSDETEDLGVDTRTFIYLEEFASALKNNYIFQGRSIARGYDSDFFGSSDDEMMGRGERQTSEVSILNIFNYMGVIGVVVYMILFSGAVVSVLRRSNNKFLFFLAVYVGYRWIWAFVEDYTRFDMNTMCLWMAIVMCYSPFFLRMNDRQIAEWARGLVKI